MSAGRADRICRRHDARPRDVAPLDTLFEGNIVEVFRPNITDCREAGFERALGIGHSDDGPEVVSELQAAVAAEARVGSQMHVHVDEARKQGHSGKFDAARVLRHGLTL